MDMKLAPLNSSHLSALRPSKGAGNLPVGSGGVGAAQGGFSTAFKTALENVSAAQNTSTEMQTQVQMGNPNVSLEQTMMAMQKAQIGFQAALHVRNRMMQAYTDVMNMQV
ncbi:MAG: hypothetical protein RI959_2105 [Pseudomonadota bacterium]|jgi:flagellar hook-basal body complex protein FliE